MAGTWLKMRHDLEDAPEVRRIARATGVDRDAVVGKLFRLWSWFDRHSVAGRLEGLELADVDDRVDCPGFAEALVLAGWLAESPAGLEIPNWERHNGDSAKTRALAQNRMLRSRYAPSATGDAEPVTLGASPEESRVPPPPPREASPGDQATLRDAWRTAAKAGHAKPFLASRLPADAHARLAEPDWLRDAIAAIAHLPRARYFRTPVNLEQFCGEGFVARILAGAYDDLATPRPAAAAGPRDDRRPAADAAAEWTRAATDPDAARRREEYLEAKARRKPPAKAAPPEPPADLEAARDAALATLATLENA